MAQNIIKIITQLQSIDNAELNEHIQNMALSTNFSIKLQTKKNHNPLKVILSKYGNPEDQMNAYNDTQHQLMKDKKEMLKHQTLLALESERVDRSLDGLNNRKSSSMALIPLSNRNLLMRQGDTKGDVNPKALFDIERIKRSKIEKELKVNRILNVFRGN